MCIISLPELKASTIACISFASPCWQYALVAQDSEEVKCSPEMKVLTIHVYCQTFHSCFSMAMKRRKYKETFKKCKEAMSLGDDDPYMPE